MRARVDGITLIGPEDPQTYAPEDPSQFCILLSVLAGAEGEQGADWFNITVCSPGWLAGHLGVDEVRSGRHYLFAQRWNWPVLEARVRAEFGSQQAATWPELAARLSRFAAWEFEDYMAGGPQ
jgi:hypothetical protein